MAPIWVALVLISAVAAAEPNHTDARSTSTAKTAAAIGSETKSLSQGNQPVSPGLSDAVVHPESCNQRPEAGRLDTCEPALLRQAVQDSLRRWSRTSDRQAPAAAAELLELLARLQADVQLPAAERQQLLGRVRNRLARLADQIARRLAAEQNASGGGGTIPASVGKAQTAAVMAQWGNFGRLGMPGARGWPGAFPPGGPRAMPAPMPGMMPGAPVGGAAAASDDHGWQLVALIQRCIAPAHWDVNGGPGSIQYFRPRRALVVTASGEVHEQVEDVLEQLHRASQ